MTNLPDVLLSSQRILFSSQDECHMRQTGQPDTVDKELKVQMKLYVKFNQK